MRRGLRRIGILVALVIAGTALYYIGKSYLWAVPETGVIETVGIIEAQEVNITSRIAGRIAVLSLNEGDMVESGQVVCQIEDIDIKNQVAKADAELANLKTGAVGFVAASSIERIPIEQALKDTCRGFKGIKVGDPGARLQA